MLQANLDYILPGHPGLQFKNTSQKQNKIQKKQKAKDMTSKLDEVAVSLSPALVKAGEL